MFPVCLMRLPVLTLHLPESQVAEDRIVSQSGSPRVMVFDPFSDLFSPPHFFRSFLLL